MPNYGSPMPAPRITPLPADERDERVQELLAGAGLGRPDGEPLNLFSTLARHPRLFKRWMQFGGTLLLGGDLPARDRELLILRTGWLTRSEYEWGQHVIIGKASGLTDEEIERVTRGPEADGWSDFDAVLLRSADELHEAARISDETWAALAERYDTTQLIEVPMLVGQYHLVGFTLNSLGIERDPGVGGFPA
ncbi:MAG: 4-carboxymuconolactone decarboxylase [Actinomycetota bacterium]